MNRTKPKLLGLLVAAGLAVAALAPVTTITGCTTSSQVEPGHDAYVIEVEKDLRTAFNVVDAFLQWEHLNRATAGRDVTAAADALRVNFPKSYASAQNVLRTYKRTRTPEAKADMATWVATINAALIEAVKNLPAAEASKAFAASN